MLNKYIYIYIFNCNKCRTWLITRVYSFYTRESCLLLAAGLHPDISLPDGEKEQAIFKSNIYTIVIIFVSEN